MRATLRAEWATIRELLRVQRLVAVRADASRRPAAGPVGRALELLLFWLAGVTSGLAVLLAGPPALPAVAAVYGFLLLAATAAGRLEALLDTQDLGVLAPHPVSGRAILASRLLSMLGSSALPGAAFAAGGTMLVAFSAHPLVAVAWTLVVTALATLLVVGAIAAAAAVLLRFARPHRFGQMALALQTAAIGSLLSIGWLARSLPRVREWTSGSADRLGALSWLPPLHYEALFQLSLGRTDAPTVARSVLALAMPPAALAAAWALAPRFAERLRGAERAASSRSRRPRLARLLTASPTERAGYELGAALCLRDPSFVRAVVPPLLALSAAGVLGALAPAAPSRPLGALAIPAALFLPLLVLPRIASRLRHSGDADASWIFDVLPVGDPRALARGALTGTAAGTLVPAILLVGGVLVVASTASVASVLLAGTLALLVVLVFCGSVRVEDPFRSKPRLDALDVADLLRSLALIPVLVLLGLAHVALTANHAVSWAGAALALGTLVAISRRRSSTGPRHR